MHRKPEKTRRKIRVVKKPSLDFSVTGLVYCTIMMFIGLAAINTQANLLFGVFGLMIGILLVSFIISGLVLNRLKVERVLPDHAIVGRPMVIYYQITNQKRFWPSLSVTITELDGTEFFSRQPSAYLLHCANKMTATVPTDIVPLKRGVVELDHYQLSTSFPFGFVKRAMTRHQKDSLVILPPIGSMRRELMQRFRSAESTGQNVHPSRGGNDEFYGVKEYRHGENPRWIYWKRSARGMGTVMREMTRVSPPKLLVLVDTYLQTDQIEYRASIERTIAMSATLIDHAMEAGLPIGVGVWNGQWITIAPNRGKRHRLELLTLLARLRYDSPEGVNGLLESARPMMKSDVTTVVISPQKVSMSLGQSVRGRLITLSSAEDQYQRYFQFDPGIDFSLGMGSERKV